MANFQEAIGKTLLNEGGYANNPADSGGETYRGISRHNWPQWPGWPIIDRYHANLCSSQWHWPVCLDEDTGLQGLVVDFYHQNFWQYDGLNDQDVANDIFDLSVNIGKTHAINILQRTIGAHVDGIYGPATEGLANRHPNGSLEPLIMAAAEDYHRAIVQMHPQDAEFLKGWLRRDSSYGV